mmetsp:Transcript_24917/g.59166  ORF Transcript_24917/g.59166 Transcript_24917/m.59166 type:complete len:87 (+) Transcript_24917:720-980(+)
MLHCRRSFRQWQPTALTSTERLSDAERYWTTLYHYLCAVTAQQAGPPAFFVTTMRCRDLNLMNPVLYYVMNSFDVQVKIANHFDIA